MAQRTNPEQENEIIECYQGGAPVNEIAATFEITKFTVYNILKRYDIAKRVEWTPRSSEQDIEIEQHYNVGETMNSIAHRLDIPVTTVRRLLVRRGVKLRRNTRVELSPEKKDIAVEMCASGGTVNAIAEHFGVSGQTITRTLRKRSVSLGGKRRPSTTLRHDAFDIITPESAYWMGFLFADGCLPRDRGSQAISINLGEEDIDHLNKFRIFLNSNHAITRITSVKKVGRPSVFFKVRSNQLANALIRNGWAPKNADRAPVGDLAQSRDFWRGVVDGDGSIGTTSNGYAAIWLFGHTALLVAFQQWLCIENLADLRVVAKPNGSAKIPTQKPIFQICTSGSTGYNIIERLYSNTKNSLTRKVEHAKNILRSCKH